MRIVSWNVNGIRAAARNGFGSWLAGSGADLVLLQETRAFPEQVPPDLLHGHHACWFPAVKPGYSGVAIVSRKPIPADHVIRGLGIPEFDNEGRFLAAVVDDVAYVSAYFPNSQPGGARLPYKIDFCNAVARRLREFERDRLGVVIGGDFNIAHKAIDLANPKQNEGNPGYLPEEREWMTRFLDDGYLDSFRLFEAGGGFYTWWSNRPGVRQRNIGWRIDYHVVSESLRARVAAAEIQASVMGSDHCPVTLILDREH